MSKNGGDLPVITVNDSDSQYEEQRPISSDGGVEYTRANSQNEDQIHLVVPGSYKRPPLSPNSTTSSQTASPNDLLNLSQEESARVEKSPFAFAPKQLRHLIDPKSINILDALGGIYGVEKGLRTDIKSGLSNDETTISGNVSFEDCANNDDTHQNFSEIQIPNHEGDDHQQNLFVDRKNAFGDNVLPEHKPNSLLKLMWMAMHDKILILLSIAAVISLSLGIYQTVGGRTEYDDEGHAEPKVDWVEGVAIIVAILIVVVVGAGNDYQKEKQFVKLNKKKDERPVKVIRSGSAQTISIHNLLAGDVLILEPGDVIPADGLLIEGHGIQCNETSVTGESDANKKMPAIDALKAYHNSSMTLHKIDPFLISGTKVLQGYGTCLVTAVGVNSLYGEIMMSLREEPEPTPLQLKLDGVAEAIAKIGGDASLLLFVVLLIRFLAQLPNNHSSSSEKGQDFVQILITAVTLVVVAVPEGLPLAVTLALAFATTRMLKDNNLVRVLKACETMGNATTICSDKTGTLTQNKMSVVLGYICGGLQFGDQSHLDKINDAQQQKPIKELVMSDMGNELPSALKDLILKSCTINTTVFEEDDSPDGLVGTKTETALVGLAKNYLGMTSLASLRAGVPLKQLIPFDSNQKCMGVVIALPDGRSRLLVKGASEIVLEKCRLRLDLNPSTSNESLPVTELTAIDKENMTNTINTYASMSLRTLGLVYKDFDSNLWPPPGVAVIPEDETQAKFQDIYKDMTLIGIVGIRDPLRPQVADAVRDCQKAGVIVRMVTGDNEITARAIAKDCGILSEGGLVMEGPVFRRLSRIEMDRIIPRLQVLARSSPEDKRLLVRRLKQQGETVAVTGDGTNDAPALKLADIGFSMGIAGTEVAKEASAIILMDDNFGSIVKALLWGRAVNDSVKKFLQFQLTVNITAIFLTFVSAVKDSRGESVLSAVQLLWVNLIMDTFAALALATDAPDRDLLERKPERKSQSIISVTMWKMMFGQAIYQLCVTYVLYFAGPKIFSVETSNEHQELNALVFNSFVWMQIFNLFNSRRIDNHLNVFKNFHRNFMFMGIILVMCGGQILIMFVGGAAFRITRQSGEYWAIAIITGFCSLILGIFIRLIPDSLLIRLFPSKLWKRFMKLLALSRLTPGQDQSTLNKNRIDLYQWHPAIEKTRDDLQFLQTVRGGRLLQLKPKVKSWQIGKLIKEKIFRQKTNSAATAAGINDDYEQQRDNHSIMSDINHHKQLVEASTGLDDDGDAATIIHSRSNSVSSALLVPGIIAGSIAGWSPVEKTDEELEDAEALRAKK